MNMNLPFIRRLLTSGAVLLLAAACSGGSLTSQWTFIPPQPTGSPGPSGATGTPCPSGGASESPAASAATGSAAASAAASPVTPAATGSPAASPSAGGSAPGSVAPSAAATVVPASAVPSVAATAVASGSASTAPASPGASSPPGQCGATGTLISLDETASLTITKDGQPVTALEVKKGDTVTFQITNGAGFDHDFYIGTADQLKNNQTAGLPGVQPFSSGMQQFTYTVSDATATLEFACTLPNHYNTMHGSFNVQP